MKDNTLEWFKKSDAEIVQNVFRDRHLDYHASSIKHFLEKGTVNGSFMQLILKCMEYKANQVHLTVIKAKQALSQHTKKETNEMD